MRAFVLFSLMLTGCTPYWTKDAAFDVTRIDVQRMADPSAPCGRVAGTTLGCTVRIRESNRALVYVKPGSDCVLMHEFRHALGWNHDDRPLYAPDCG